MTYCNAFVPKHQAQLGPDGGPYGYANCTASSAGMAAQAHTCGSQYYSGAKIRAATNEPVPDPKSPGLNLSQAHAALIRLGGSSLDLDVRYGYDFDAYKARLTKGAQAVLQINRRALIEHGQGYGNSFAGGHAIHTYVKAGEPWFDDPLTGPHLTTWAVLRLAAGSLDTGSGIVGYGKVYAMFTRDITAEWWATVRPKQGQTTRQFVRYLVSAGVVTGHAVKRTRGFEVRTTPPQWIRTASGNRVSLVMVTKPGSSIDGWWLSSDWAKEVP